jgi:hypothetical protein
MLGSEFIIDKDFIKFQIPSNLRNTWVFERVIDIIYATISNDTNAGKKIGQYYSDVEFYTTDFTKLSLEMKLQKLKDNGYEYLVDIFGSDNEALNDLASFLALIKALKGREEGFRLILNTLGFTYKFSSWEDSEYKGEIFTATIKIALSSEQSQLASSVIEKLQDVARNYLAPQVNIEYTVIEELVSEDYGFNNYFSAGYCGTNRYPEFEITRSL